MTETSGPGTTPPNTKECPHCGASNPADAGWCSLCLKRFTAPARPPPVLEDPKQKKWTAGRIVGWTVAVILILSGLVSVGFFLLMSIAMANFGSNK